ncbi:MAG: hypothetical protein JWO72_1418 [Caulobacteraceae bacterium]|nr:hypothetical protein [Caulobacteraceae bacterium]
MKSLKTWIDLAALLACVGAVGLAVFTWISAVQASGWAAASQGNAVLGVFAIILGVTVLNCFILLGIAVCKARADARARPSGNDGDTLAA